MFRQQLARLFFVIAPCVESTFCLMIFMLMALLTLAIFSLFLHCFQTQAVFGLSHLAALAECTHGFMSCALRVRTRIRKDLAAKIVYLMKIPSSPMDQLC